MHRVVRIVDRPDETCQIVDVVLCCHMEQQRDDMAQRRLERVIGEQSMTAILVEK